MRVASELAGFTLGEADLLRKAMGKKNPALMQAQREKFVAGATGRGISAKKADARLRPDGAVRRLRLQQVALDGLRAARVPDRVPEGQLPVALHGGAADHRVAEHREAGHPTSTSAASCACRSSPPDINSSELAFTVRPEGVRFGLGAVKNVGESAIAVDPAGARGPRAHRRRCSTSARTSTCAWSTSGCSRASSRAARWIRSPQASRPGRRRPRGCGRGCWPPSTAPSSTATATSAIATRGRRSCSAAGRTATPRARMRRSPAAAPWTEAQQLAFEKEALGLYLSGHPIDRHKADLAAYGAKSLEDLLAAHEEEPEAAAGADDEEAAMGGGRSQGRIERGRLGRRHRRVHPAAEDAGRATAWPPSCSTTRTARSRWSCFPRRSRRPPRCSRPTPWCWSRAGSSATRTRRGCWRPRSSRSRRCGSSWRREVVVDVDAAHHDRRTFEAVSDVLGRHKGDRRVAFFVTTSTRAAAAGAGRRVGPGARAARRSSSWPISSGSAGRDRSRCGRIRATRESHGRRTARLRRTDRRPAQGDRRPEHDAAAPSRARPTSSGSAARVDELRAELFAALTPWQVVQVVAPRGPAGHARLHRAALHRLRRDARRPPLRRRPGHRVRDGAVSRRSRARRRAPEGPDDEGEDRAQLRLRAAGRLPQGAAGDADGREVPPARHRLRRHAGGVPGDRIGGAGRRRGHRAQPARDGGARRPDHRRRLRRRRQRRRARHRDRRPRPHPAVRDLQRDSAGRAAPPFSGAMRTARSRRPPRSS